MPVTRDQASRLLTQPEMVLFGDSRNPALRALTASGLGKRIERVRKLRDKSRDLLQRQRLSSRDRTGSKRGVSGDANDRTRRKGEVLADILQRFEARLKDVERADKQEAKREATAAAVAKEKAAVGKAAAAVAKEKAAVGKAAAVKRTALKARAKKVAARSAGATRATAKAAPGASASKAARPAVAKSAGKAKVVKKASARNTKPAGVASKAAASGRDAVSSPKPKPAKRAAPAAITPKRALANTRALLKAKQRHDAEPKPWQTLGGHADHEPHVAGLTSGIAADKAEELHAGESRMSAIEGSISTRDRHHQGKRDAR